MSKKGPRSGGFQMLTASLSEEVLSHYLELAYYVREQELARRREIERRKSAIKRAKRAAMQAAWEEACRKAGIPLPEKPGKGKPKKAKAKSKTKSKAKTKAKANARPKTKPETAAVAAAGGDAATTAVGASEASSAAEAAEATPARSLDEVLAEAAEAPLAEPVPEKNPAKSRARKPITREDILKLYVADSLGYLDKVRADGWGGLSCAESGRVGGMMTRRMKRMEKGLPLA